MADAILKTPLDTTNTGPKVDLESLTVGANIVNRQRTQIAGTTATAIADVDVATRALQVSIVKELANVAHDAADTGGPNKIGAKAVASVSAQTPVAANDRTDMFAGLDGVLITRPHCNLEDLVDGNNSNTDGTSTQVIAAGGSGIKQYLTTVILTNTSATDIYVEMKSGTTVKATIPVPKNAGATVAFVTPLKPNAANEAWNFDPSAAATTVFCTALGFKSKL